MKGLEGTKLGRYELLCLIAQGGMSEVYLGYDRRVRRNVAVKVLYGNDEPFVRRFEREAQAVGTLAHDHILPLYDFGTQRPWYYLVMPFIEGGTLRDYLVKRERFMLDEAGSFLDQIASALQHAHDHGVIHRDVKPSNILLRLDGYAYLVDFGLAKAKQEAESLTHAGMMIGTPEYMAPEQSDGVNDHRSDIYSLGIILYQMLTGRVPFAGESPVAVTLKHIQMKPPSPRQFNSEIPPSIEQIMLKALAKSPEERYQQARDFAQAYHQALTQETRVTDTIACVSVLEAVQTQNNVETGDQAEESNEQSSVQTLLPEPPPRPRLFPLAYTKSPLPIPVGIKKQNNWLRTGLPLVGVAIISVLLLTSLLWKHTSAPPPSGPTSPNPTTLVHAETATAQTKTANLQATLAAQARVQTTTGITSAIGTGNLLYYNAMTTPGGGWMSDGKQCYFSPQGYHVATHLSHAAAWCYTNKQAFSDVVITTQARLLHGDIYGLAFRLNPTTRAFYVLELNSQGQYRFQRALGKDPTHWLTLIDWTYSQAITPGYGQLNTFLIIAERGQFRFYINQQLIVFSFIDQTFTTGLLGLLVGGDSDAGSEAIFTNVAVFQH